MIQELHIVLLTLARSYYQKGLRLRCTQGHSVFPPGNNIANSCKGNCDVSRAFESLTPRNIACSFFKFSYQINCWKPSSEFPHHELLHPTWNSQGESYHTNHLIFWILISSPRFQMSITKNLPSLTNNRVCLCVFHHQCQQKKNWKVSYTLTPTVALVFEMLYTHIQPTRSLVFD